MHACSGCWEVAAYADGKVLLKHFAMQDAKLCSDKHVLTSVLDLSHFYIYLIVIQELLAPHNPNVL